MMVNAITVLQERLDSITNHLEVLKRIKIITRPLNIENNDIKYIKSQQTKEKIFNYQTNIISLYGAFEFFVEEVFKEYIECLKKIVPQYDKLDNKIINNYFDNVAKLHSKLNYAKFSHITERQIVQNLERVIVQNRNEIIAESYLGNGGNYKHDVVCKLMSSIGIFNVNGDIVKISPLSDLLTEATTDVEHQRKMVQFRIDDLVDRRNEVAHGVTTDDIIDIDSFEKMLNLIQKYCLSLNKLLEHKLLTYMWEHSSSSIYIPDKVYGNFIVALKVKNIQIGVGDKILIERNNYPRYIEATILGIRIKDDIKILEEQSLFIDDLERLISIKVTCKIKINDHIKFI